MTIDIKTLHIGSHVEYKGKIVRICSLKTNMANYDEGKGKPRCYSCMKAYYKYLQPIPITPDLLTELGFIREPNVGKMNFDYLWISKDENSDVCWLYGEKDNFFLLQSGAFGQIHVKYLHEAEAFLALHGVELVKE